MFDRVLKAMVESRLETVYVVSPDEGILEHGSALGARTILEYNPSGANSAVELANKKAIKDGFEATLVAFSDIPLISKRDLNGILDLIIESNRCVAALRSRRGGTNLLLRKPPSAIPSRYGKNSFIKHRDETMQNRIPFFEYVSNPASLDVDTISDLRLLFRGERSAGNELEKEEQFRISQRITEALDWRSRE